jgi:hypothetical protein
LPGQSVHDAEWKVQRYILRRQRVAELAETGAN